ncbi:MAG: STAS domain-containing protein [Zoogloeaceae bacterium]|jgi:phospholipid transport system transporter-binding protein|nr:STAS domain-containing protein [Zoogloeaceae bacterium]
MIRDAGDRIEVSGPLTLGQAREMLEAGSALIQRSETVFDLSQVQEVDSSGLTVVFGWARAAKRQGKVVRISNPPRNLLSLAALYGVTELLPLA